MSSRRPAQRVQDIIENGRAILDYTAGMDLADLKANQMAYDAVERCFERIAEASVKLGALAILLMPDQPWDEIRGLGNKLRHEYDRITRERLWSIAQEGLPALVADCEKALAKLAEANPY